MGSLENGVPPKRTLLLRSSPWGSGRSFLHRPRSKLARFLLFEKVNYIQWICTAATFFFMVILFQAFLPVSVVEKAGNFHGLKPEEKGMLGSLSEIGDLEFGEGIRFVPSKLLERFKKERDEAKLASLGRGRKRAGLVKPRLALVLADLFLDATHLQMVTIAVALKEVGYDIEIYVFEDGPVRSIWTRTGFPVTIISENSIVGLTIDWLNYNGVLVNSLEAKPILSCLCQEPFKSIPVIWVIYEKSLALHLEQYSKDNNTQLICDWKQSFSRATVVLFPSPSLPIMYSAFDVGNYLLLPGSPAEAWSANNYIKMHDSRDLRSEMGYESDDFIITIVGSQFSYSGSFLEHILVLQALAPVLREFSSASQVKISIMGEDSSSAYDAALEVTALKFGFTKGCMHQIVSTGNFSTYLGISDVVVYASFLEEEYFPSVLIQAMSLGKLVISPDLTMIKKYVEDKVHGYLFPKENIGMLTQILTTVISNGKLSDLARNVASNGREFAINLMVPEVLEGYVLLLENILKFPSEVALPKGFEEIPFKLKEKWQWSLFENITHMNYLKGRPRKDSIVDKLEKKWNQNQTETSVNASNKLMDEAFFSINWAKEKSMEIANARKRLLDEELKDRTDQSHGTWDDIYRNIKRAERIKNELHEQDDRELERIGQPLCIYEPYYGEGVWPFLHNTSLYRGIGLSSKGRRPGGDDVDASSRLPVLNNAYYRDTLGEHGAFFALANRIDRIHKNAWIGFQSWRLMPRKAFLTKKAEATLLEAIESKQHGDALYFWARMDKDPRNPHQHDFWSFCDAINAGNCRFAVSDTLRKMYGMPSEWDSLPPMPANGDSWSVMHSWAMPTRSFLEFVMFSRMYVDALDAQIYDEHHQSGFCYLSLSKDRHCYSRVLELLVNVWAYHSARRMIYVNPETGSMEEHHRLKTRRGHMWIRWFSFSTLKSMDEDLAEEFDADNPARRWLWPSTGEVFWQGIYQRERNLRQQQKERKKQQSKDKILRIKKRARQKVIGKYIKPSPEEIGDSNATMVL